MTPNSLSPIDSNANADACYRFLRGYKGYQRDETVNSADSWKNFVASSRSKQWVYLIDFRDVNRATAVYAWGTAAGDGARLKKSGMLEVKLTGKYDRRGEYLMLRAFFGQPIVRVFEFSVKATEPEQAWRKKTVGKAPCILGLCGTDRDEMARSTFEIFKLSGDWRNADAQDQELFTEFIDTIYLAKLKHPRRDATFHYGDCLEPGFIASTLDRPDVWDVVLKLLKVK